MDALSLAEDIIKNVIKKGCDKAEVFIKTAKRLSVKAKDSKVEALESSREFGISLKVIKRQKLGFSFTTSPVKINRQAGRQVRTEFVPNTYRGGVEDIINNALKGADWTDADKYVDIPDYSPPSDVLVLDEKIENLKEEDIIRNALLLERTSLDYDKKIRKVRTAEIELAIGKTTILNSRGVNISYKSSYLSAHVDTLATNGQDSQMGWDFASSRKLSDVDFVSIARGASKRALALLGAKKISAIKAPVIFEPSVAADFLEILSSSMSAEAVQKKRSFLADKVNKSIISPLISITDDGLMPWGIGTRPADDEGVPATKKELVSKGILTGFIHNTYTANREGTQSTGNAARRSFKSLPGIDTTNLYINKAGVRGQESGREDRGLIKSMSKGLLILEAMGVHTANPISGDFSIGISGLWIENGKVLYPVKEAIIAGNILELFKRVEKVGNDLKFYGKIGSPSLLTGEMDISA